MLFAGVSSLGEGNQLEVLPTRLSLSLRGAQPKTPDIHPPPFKPRGNIKINKLVSEPIPSILVVLKNPQYLPISDSIQYQIWVL